MVLVLTSPRITVSWWGTILIQKFQANYKISSTRPLWSMSTTKRFLVVGGGSGSGSSAAMGLHFPQEQLTWLTPIFARLLSSVPRFRGRRHSAPRQARNLANTIARDKPVSTFECTRKHYENRYNMAGDDHALKIIYDHLVGHKNLKVSRYTQAGHSSLTELDNSENKDKVSRSSVWSDASEGKEINNMPQSSVRSDAS